MPEDLNKVTTTRTISVLYWAVNTCGRLTSKVSSTQRVGEMLTDTEGSGDSFSRSLEGSARSKSL